MKKLTSALLIIFLLFSMTACEGSFALYSSGTHYINGEKFTYKIHSLREKRSPGEITLSFKELEGSYPYQLSIRNYSYLEYRIIGDTEGFSAKILENGQPLTLPEGLINVSSYSENRIHIILSSEFSGEIEIYFKLIK